MSYHSTGVRRYEQRSERIDNQQHAPCSWLPERASSQHWPSKSAKTHRKCAHKRYARVSGLIIVHSAEINVAGWRYACGGVYRDVLESSPGWISFAPVYALNGMGVCDANGTLSAIMRANQRSQVLVYGKKKSPARWR